MSINGNNTHEALQQFCVAIFESLRIPQFVEWLTKKLIGIDNFLKH